MKVIKSDGQLSASKQIADIEAAVVQGVDGIIIAPADVDALAPAVRSAIQAGVPVVTIDRPVNGVPEVLANVAADNFAGAVHQGEAVAKLFPARSQSAAAALDMRLAHPLHLVLQQRDRIIRMLEIRPQVGRGAADEARNVRELSDAQWERVAPLLPGKPGDPGRSGQDNRAPTTEFLLKPRPQTCQRRPCRRAAFFHVAALRAIGKRMTIRVPRLGLVGLSTTSVPPIVSTRLRQMDRPSSVPAPGP